MRDNKRGVKIKTKIIAKVLFSFLSEFKYSYFIPIFTGKRLYFIILLYKKRA